ncbi:MAG: 2-oxo acid dehydrogenase subunit E2 [Deltaproteobacteria bacterium]|nr:2-oxo acid dehydrogenase subunit E2 [Deltaproteobacteria bacterium]
MAYRVVMPKVSDATEEGRLVKWLKQEGDRVESGEPIAEIESDKGVLEMEAFSGGVLRKVIGREGEIYPVGAVLGVIAEPDENLESLLALGAGAVASPATPAPGPAERGQASAEKAVRPAAEPAPTPAEKVKASPLARNLAAEAGIDLSQVRGSGPGGRVVKEDVEAFLQARAAAPAPTPAAARPPLRAVSRPSPEVEFEERDLSLMRKAIARRLIQSKAPVPHFYLTTEVDMEGCARLREAIGALGDLPKVTYTDLIIKACAVALTRHPEVNAAFMGDKLRLYSRVRIGLAVAVEDGLITPVIRDADRKGLRQIAEEAHELAARARDRRLRPEEYTGATFSVSNLGMFDVEEFSAVINPPEACILAVGAVADKPVAEGGQVVVRKRMRLTLSCDHRAVDGATGARFLQEVKRILEQPALLAL